MEEIVKISEDNLNHLSNSGLTARMDSILSELSNERMINYPNIVKTSIANTTVLTKDFYKTKAFQHSPSSVRREMLIRLFYFLIQREIIYLAICQPNTNRGKLNSFLEKHANEQWIIISSVIAWEALIEYVYFIDKKIKIEYGSKSKYKTLEKWMLERSNFSYFTLVCYEALLYDHGKRGTEIHGNSSRYRNILKLEETDYDELNNNLELYNILINIIPPLVDLCNGNRPNTITMSKLDKFNWVDTYFKGNKIEYQEKIDEIINSMKSFRS